VEVKLSACRCLGMLVVMEFDGSKIVPYNSANQNLAEVNSAHVSLE